MRDGRRWFCSDSLRRPQTFTVATQYSPPSGGDGENILQARLSSELAEYLEVPPGDSAETLIGYAIDIDVTFEFQPIILLLCVMRERQTALERL